MGGDSRGLAYLSSSVRAWRTFFFFERDRIRVHSPLTRGSRGVRSIDATGSVLVPGLRIVVLWCRGAHDDRGRPHDAAAARWQIALLHSAPLAGAYLLWLVAAPPSDQSVPHATHPTDVIRFALVGLRTAFARVGQLPGFGIALAGILVGGLVLIYAQRGTALLRGPAAAPIALLLGAIIFLVLTGIVRASAGATLAGQQRVRRDGWRQPLYVRGRRDDTPDNRNDRRRDYRTLAELRHRCDGAARRWTARPHLQVPHAEGVDFIHRRINIVALVCGPGVAHFATRSQAAVMYQPQGDAHRDGQEV